MLGTTWVAPHIGSTVDELYEAFVRQDASDPDLRFLSRFEQPTTRGAKTNLRLTGKPITEYDWNRLLSEAFSYEVL